MHSLPTAALDLENQKSLVPVKSKLRAWTTWFNGFVPAKRVQTSRGFLEIEHCMNPLGARSGNSAIQVNMNLYLGLTDATTAEGFQVR